MPYHRGRPVAVSGRRPQRRKLVWATFAATHSIATAAKTNDDLLGNLETVGASVLGCTIMRTHLYLAVTDTVTGAPAMGLYVGLIVDSAPTVTNLDPSTSFGDDWMLLREIAPGYARQAVTLGDAGSHIYYGDIIDLRAKRKCEELNEKYFLCLENAGANTVSVGIFARTLIALP